MEPLPPELARIVFSHVRPSTLLKASALYACARRVPRLPRCKTWSCAAQNLVHARARDALPWFVAHYRLCQTHLLRNGCALLAFWCAQSGDFFLDVCELFPGMPIDDILNNEDECDILVGVLERDVDDNVTRMRWVRFFACFAEMRDGTAFVAWWKYLLRYGDAFEWGLYFKHVHMDDYSVLIDEDTWLDPVLKTYHFEDMQRMLEKCPVWAATVWTTIDPWLQWGHARHNNDVRVPRFVLDKLPNLGKYK